MTSTSVSDAMVIPQSQGTGLSGENAPMDAGLMSVLARSRGDQAYVDEQYASGMAFQNHSASNDTVEVAPGAAFVKDGESSTAGARAGDGSPRASKEAPTDSYDHDLPGPTYYLVVFPTATQISVQDSTLNEVHIDIDVSSNNVVDLEHDGSSTASPGSTSLKIGETNPDDSSQDTRANDGPVITARSLDTDDASVSNAPTNDTDVARKKEVDAAGEWITVDTVTNSDTSQSIDKTFSNLSGDEFRLLIRSDGRTPGGNSVTWNLRVNDFSNSDYNYYTENNSSSNSYINESEWKLIDSSNNPFSCGYIIRSTSVEGGGDLSRPGVGVSYSTLYGGREELQRGLLSADEYPVTKIRTWSTENTTGKVTLQKRSI